MYIFNKNPYSISQIIHIDDVIPVSNDYVEAYLNELEDDDIKRYKERIRIIKSIYTDYYTQYLYDRIMKENASSSNLIKIK